MSTGETVAVVLGTDYAATVMAGAYLAAKVVGRLRVVIPQQPLEAVPVIPAIPAAGEESPKAVTPLPPGEAVQRREEFARLRTEEGKSVAEARLAVGIAERTARRYEAERLGRPGAA